MNADNGAIRSPFEGGRNKEVFDAMLDLRFKEWARIRRNRLARRRYKEAKHNQN